MSIHRITRDDGPNAVFHLTARVNWRRWHIDDDATKAILAELLREAAESFGVEILAWVFMSNHLHLVVQSPRPGLYAQLTSRVTASRHVRPWNNGHLRCSVLAQFMRRLRHRMSIHRQRELGVTGHFWESTYDARRIQNGLSLALRIAYDHCNPVKAGIAARPEDYRWSSARQWATGEEGPVRVSFGNPVPFDLDPESLRRDVLQLQRRTDADPHIAAIAALCRSKSADACADIRRYFEEKGLR